MSYNLGTAEGVITTTYNGKGVDQANRDVDELTSKHEKASAAIGSVGKASGVAGLAIAAGIGLAVKSAADFEQRMSGVQAVSGASAEEMDQLSKKALQLGKDTSFSATDAASAIEELVKAGISVPDVMNGAADATVALAAAGEIDLPQAAAIASNAMNQFNLSAQQMPKVADLIAGAANASAIDVGDFGQSLSQVGAVANLVGASFDDTAAAIALMGNAGIKGSDAGTSLKTMLTNLQPQTKKQADLMKQLGIITEDGKNIFFDANGKLGDMADVAGILNRSLKGMTAAQKQATLTTLFGSDAVRAAAVFANEGAVGFSNMARSMTKVTAADVAAKRLDNFKGSLEQMKGSLETAGIVIGQILLPALRKIVDAVTAVANKFLNLDQNTQELILGIIGIVGAALLVIAAVLKIITTVQKVITILKALRLAFATTWLAALGPIALIIVAVAAVIAIIVLLWKKSETFRNIVLAVWNAIKTGVQAVVDFFTGVVWPALQAVWNGIQTGASALAGFFVGLWNGIVSVTKTVWSAIAGFFASLWSGVVGVFTAVWNTIVSIFTTFFNIIKTIITTYINVWVTIIMAVFNVLMGWWRTFWGIFGGVITAAFNLVLAVINLVTKAILFAISWVVQQVIAVVTGWVKTVINLVTAGWNAVSSATTKAWNATYKFISSVLSAIRNFIVSVFNAVRSFITSVWNAIYSYVSARVTAIRNVVTSVFNAVRSFIISVFNAVAGFISSIWNSIYSRIAGPVAKIKSNITSGFNAAKSAAQSAFSSMLSVVGSLINQVYTKVSGIVSRIKGIFAGAGSWLYNAGRNIIQGLLNGIESLINSVTSKLNWLTDHIPKVKGPEQRDKKLLRPAGKWIMEGFVDELAKGVDDALSLLSNTTGMIPDTITARSINEVMPATGLSSPVTVAATGATTTLPSKSTIINLNAYNPVGKTSAEELNDQATRLATLGVLG